MDRRYEAARRILPVSFHPTVEKATAFAPVNIALIKYWGKRDIPLHLPVTDSFSITIGAGTTTTVSQNHSKDTVILNGVPLDESSSFYTRLVAFLDLIRPNRTFYFAISTTNDIPTAAGLASSASGFAALVLALNSFFSWNLTHDRLSYLARLGSGSACRSIQPGFAHWEKGIRTDGLDSYSKHFPAIWPELSFGIFMVSSEQKPISSAVAMQRTVETSTLFPQWASCVENGLAKLIQSIQEKDFSLFGKTLEQNALTMHATMHAAWPPIVYWQPQTVATLHSIFEARKEGLPIYATMDAGPNIKVFFLKKDAQEVLRRFPHIQTIDIYFSKNSS